MKVTFLFPGQFGLFPDVYEYCVLLKDAGIEVAYVGRSDRRKGWETHESGVVLLHLDRNALGSRRAMVQKMAACVDEIRPDIAHVFCFRGCGLLPLLSRNRHTRWIVDVRSLHVEDRSGRVSRRRSVKNRLTWLESQTYDYIIALTKTIEAMLQPSLRPIASLPLGASARRLNPANRSELRAAVREAFGVGDATPVILYAGSVSPSRGLHRVVEAFSLVAGSCPESRFFLVGGNDNKDFLEDLITCAKELGVRESMTFTRRVPYDQVHKFFCASDIGVSYVPLNTPYELQPPTKLIEYMMCDNMVPVCNDAPASVELATDMHNAVVCKSSVEGIAEGLRRALDILRRDVDFTRLRQNARQAVRDLDWSTIVNTRLLPLYDQVLSRGKE